MSVGKLILLKTEELRICLFSNETFRIKLTFLERFLGG